MKATVSSNMKGWRPTLLTQQLLCRKSSSVNAPLGVDLATAISRPYTARLVSVRTYQRKNIF